MIIVRFTSLAFAMLFIFLRAASGGFGVLTIPRLPGKNCTEPNMTLPRDFTPPGATVSVRVGSRTATASPASGARIDSLPLDVRLMVQISANGVPKASFPLDFKKFESDTVNLVYRCGYGTWSLSAEIPAHRKGHSMQNQLFPIVCDGKYGYIDRSGAVIIEPRYRAAGAFAEDRAPVIVDRLWCYIDRSGAVKIPGAFSTASAFSEGLASVADSSGRPLYIDTLGRETITPEKLVHDGDRADRAYPFSDGIAAIRCYTKIYFINHDGRVLFVKEDVSSNMPPILSGEHLIPFGVTMADSAKFGFMNHQGAFVIKPHYDLVGMFSEGLALVGTKMEKRFVSSDRGGRGEDTPVWFYNLKFIDTKGKTVLAIDPDQEGTVPAFSCGLTFCTRDTQPGYYNKKGALVLAPQFDSHGSFVNGLALASKYVYPETLTVNLSADRKRHEQTYIDLLGTIVWRGSGGIVEYENRRSIFLRD